MICVLFPRRFCAVPFSGSKIANAKNREIHTKHKNRTDITEWLAVDERCWHDATPTHTQARGWMDLDFWWVLVTRTCVEVFFAQHTRNSRIFAWHQQIDAKNFFETFMVKSALKKCAVGDPDVASLSTASHCVMSVQFLCFVWISRVEPFGAYKRQRKSEQKLKN
jgi:hypothetical protein